jgi:hypothetical protein
VFVFQSTSLTEPHLLCCGRPALSATEVSRKSRLCFPHQRRVERARRPRALIDRQRIDAAGWAFAGLSRGDLPDP